MSQVKKNSVGSKGQIENVDHAADAPNVDELQYYDDDLIEYDPVDNDLGYAHSSVENFNHKSSGQVGNMDSAADGPNVDEKKEISDRLVEKQNCLSHMLRNFRYHQSNPEEGCITNALVAQHVIEKQNCLSHMLRNFLCRQSNPAEGCNTNATVARYVGGIGIQHPLDAPYLARVVDAVVQSNVRRFEADKTRNFCGQYCAKPDMEGCSTNCDTIKIIGKSLKEVLLAKGIIRNGFKYDKT